MPLVYDKLWCRLAEKDLNKTDLLEMASISRSTLSKLSKNDTVTTDTLDRICEALGCDIGDIVAHVSSLDIQTILIESMHREVNTMRFRQYMIPLGSWNNRMRARASSDHG